MPRYIDAKQIRYSWMIDADGEEHDGVTLQSIVDKVPTADVVEVKYGIKHKSSISNTGLMCTACFSDIDRDAVFCKYCGAKMDGIKDG